MLIESLSSVLYSTCIVLNVSSQRGLCFFNLFLNCCFFKDTYFEYIFSLQLSDDDDVRKDELIDRRKIDSISWLLYDKLQRAEAMYQANALTRSFVASEKYEFAKDAWYSV